MIMMMPS